MSLLNSIGSGTCSIASGFDSFPANRVVTAIMLNANITALPQFLNTTTNLATFADETAHQSAFRLTIASTPFGTEYATFGLPSMSFHETDIRPIGVSSHPSAQSTP